MQRRLHWAEAYERYLAAISVACGVAIGLVQPEDGFLRRVIENGGVDVLILSLVSTGSGAAILILSRGRPTRAKVQTRAVLSWVCCGLWVMGAVAFAHSEKWLGMATWLSFAALELFVFSVLITVALWTPRARQ